MDVIVFDEDIPPEFGTKSARRGKVAYITRTRFEYCNVGDDRVSTATCLD